MRRAIRQCVEVFANTFAPQGLIVEIGSYFVPGSAALCDLRPVFGGIDFVGCDIRAGGGHRDAAPVTGAVRRSGVGPWKNRRDVR